jgi:hypothetical protein
VIGIVERLLRWLLPLPTGQHRATPDTHPAETPSADPPTMSLFRVVEPAPLERGEEQPGIEVTVGGVRWEWVTP